MLNTHHELSQAHYNSFSQNPQDFIDEINLPEDSNPYSLGFRTHSLNYYPILLLKRLGIVKS